MQRTVRQETTKYETATLPLNMYQTALHQGERLEFALEKEHQNDFSRNKGEKVRFHQGILELISFLNMMKTLATATEEDDEAVEESSAGPWLHTEQGTRFSFCCAQNKQWTDDKGI